MAHAVQADETAMRGERTLKGVRPLLALALSTACVTALVGGSGCSKDDEDVTLSREALLDPTTCGKCHEDHFREWSGSMHAYAAEDPVFLAMNKRFQRETNGKAGDFCVRCHAPMAVHDGKTKDGLNLADLPSKYRGVTCFFCHTAESVGQLHNNGLELADTTVMRGPFADPVKNTAHHSTSSDLHDQRRIDSSTMCGSCHDIVTPGGAHVERTFEEWKGSLFATETGQTCGKCHMKSASGLRPIANTPGVFARTAHTHTFAAVDRALTPWPNADEQTAEVNDFMSASLQTSLCVTRQNDTASMRIVLDNVFAGHSFPSGASGDRRVWVELVGTKQGQVVWQSGVVEDGKAVAEGPLDPNLWVIRDFLYDASGAETHQFGQATCYESRLLPFPITAVASDPRFYQRNIVKDYPADGSYIPLPDTITMRVRMIPVGLDVLDDLIGSGDLDPAIRAKMVPIDVGAPLVWTAATATAFVDRSTTIPYECVTNTNQDFRANKFPPPRTNTCGR
jgi:hypothetical protein